MSIGYECIHNLLKIKNKIVPSSNIIECVMIGRPTSQFIVPKGLHFLQVINAVIALHKSKYALERYQGKT